MGPPGHVLGLTGVLLGDAPGLARGTLGDGLGASAAPFVGDPGLSWSPSEWVQEPSRALFEGGLGLLPWGRGSL